MLEIVHVALLVTAFLLVFRLASKQSARARLTCTQASRWPVLALTLLAASGPTGAAEDNSLLLVADPRLNSSVFQRSVVLVTLHGKGAALGVIINHPIPMDSARLFPGDDLLRGAGEIHYGGPVNPATLVFLFRAQEIPTNALHLFDNVFMSNDRELLAEQMRRPREESGLQVYAGHAGWAPGQLQAEIMHGSWSTVKANVELLFDTDRASIWERLAREKIENWI